MEASKFSAAFMMKSPIDPSKVIDAVKQTQKEYKERVNNLSKGKKKRLQKKAFRKFGEDGSFYSKKHKVFVEAEDGVLINIPKKPENYKKI